MIVDLSLLKYIDFMLDNENDTGKLLSLYADEKIQLHVLKLIFVMY
jgi:hypothetical protein